MLRRYTAKRTRISWRSGRSLERGEQRVPGEWDRIERARVDILVPRLTWLGTRAPHWRSHGRYMVAIQKTRTRKRRARVHSGMRYMYERMRAGLN